MTVPPTAFNAVALPTLLDWISILLPDTVPRFNVPVARKATGLAPPLAFAETAPMKTLPGAAVSVIPPPATRLVWPEIISGAESEYLSLKDKLESDQLEDQERRRSSTDRMADRDAPAYLRAFGG